MAKASIDTDAAAQPVHTRTTADAVESQVSVIGIDGSDSVVPADATAGLKVDTELPAAAALSDVNANPTTSMVGGPMLVYNGTTWERTRTASGVNQTPFGDPGQTGTTVLGYDGPSGNIRVLRMAAADALATNDMLGTAIMAYNGTTMDRMRGDTTNGLDVDVTRHPKVQASANLIDVDETEDQIKATAGEVHGWYLYNNGAAVVYVKFYNATAATVVVGTTTPAFTLPVPAGSAANLDGTNGIEFSTAITIAATTGVAVADTGAPATNQVVATVFYD